jgi:hypothetical protein
MKFFKTLLLSHHSVQLLRHNGQSNTQQIITKEFNSTIGKKSGKVIGKAQLTTIEDSDLICKDHEKRFGLEIETNRHNEARWTLLNACTGVMIIEATATGILACLDSRQKYEFTVYNNFQEGIDIDGYTIHYDNELIANGKDFGFSESTMIGSDVCKSTKSFTTAATMSGPPMPPVESSSCPVNEVLGQTYYFKSFNACWKLELFEGGTLEADFTDPECENQIFTPSGIFSQFDGIDESKNTALFVKGHEGFNGSIQFKKSSSILESTLKVLHYDEKREKNFAVELTVPSCGASSSSDSTVNNDPSLNDMTTEQSQNERNLLSLYCDVTQMFSSGKTHHFKIGEAGDACWKLELSNGGMFDVDWDGGECTDDNFSSSGRSHSYFSSIMTDENKLFYDGGYDAYSATFQFKQDINTNIPYGIVSGTHDNGVFDVILNLPSCE